MSTYVSNALYYREFGENAVRVTMADFTFWISLSLSLFAQSEIRTERKLNQKVKSIFLFGLSPKDLAKRLS